MLISTDEELRARGIESLKANRFEEMHELLMRAGLLTEDEWKIGPNLQRHSLRLGTGF